jgi:pimeloyl-ACP methyl ester carboxylesterase
MAAVWFDRMMSGRTPPAPEWLDLRAGELDVAALAWGAQDGPLALLLHGYPDTAWTWRHVGPRLAARGMRAVAPFARGYAPTQLAPDGCYEVAALARDTIELRGQLGGDERAILIGHDWGAVTAYLLAALRPELFRRVVTLAVPPPASIPAIARTPGRTLLELPRLLRQLRLSWYMFFQLLPVLSERALPRLIPALWRAWSPGYDGRADVSRVLAALARPGGRTAALRYYRAFFLPWMRDRRYAPERRALLAPPLTRLLYLHGERDGCMHADTARRGAESLPPDCRFELLPGVGHFLQLEAPELVTNRIAAFVDEPG